MGGKCKIKMHIYKTSIQFALGINKLITGTEGIYLISYCDGETIVAIARPKVDNACIILLRNNIHHTAYEPWTANFSS